MTDHERNLTLELRASESLFHDLQDRHKKTLCQLMQAQDELEHARKELEELKAR